MPPKAPEKNHFDTTNSDDIKKYFRLFLQAIKELDDQSVNRSLGPQAQQTKHFDRMNSDDIKDSFLSFSQTIKDLDIQLDKFKNGSLRVGDVKGLSSTIEKVQECLKRTREIFFRNATALVPGLHELALRECKREARGPTRSSEGFHIRRQYFNKEENDWHPQNLKELAEALEQLAGLFGLLRARTDEFQEITEQGSRLRSLFLTLRANLHYRATCAEDYSENSNTAALQRYTHQFIYDLENDFKSSGSAINDFTANSLPAIRAEKVRAFQSLTNILTAATLFSGVTASALQMSTALSDQNNTILVVNALWFTSLILSVGAALNCVLNGVFVRLLDANKQLISSNSNSGELPPWIKMWMDGSHNFLLGASILTFSVGLSVFTFSSNQASYTPYLTIASMMLASAGLGAILFWILQCKIWMTKWQVGATKPSGDLINKTSLFRGITTCIKGALPGSFPRKLLPWDKEKIAELGESPSQEHGFPDRVKVTPKAGKVKNANINLQKKHNPDESGSSASHTKLILPDDPASEKKDFGSYGSIRYLAYSDDGKCLAITCAKENTYESWTIVIDAKTLQSKKTTFHQGFAISEFLKWSPSGKKLFVKFELESRFDIWDLDNDTLGSFLTEEGDVVEDATWFDEAILVAERSKFTKMDALDAQTEYHIENAHIRSIGIEKTKNYIILIKRVVKSSEQSEHTYGPENQIAIYDMEEENEIYRVPVLEDISFVYLVPNTPDIFITDKGQKTFQLWSLDLEYDKDVKLTPRTIAPHRDPGDYIGPARIGGNNNQFVFNVTKSGDIDIWVRESGMPYLRFRSSRLRDEGVHCFSWRRSDDETATFVTAGNERDSGDSGTLLLWRGLELHPSDSPLNANSGNHSQPAVDVAFAPSSTPPLTPSGMDNISTAGNNVRVTGSPE